MESPFHLSFKLIALSPRINVTDTVGETICHGKQKMFKLNDAVRVFHDENRHMQLCGIKDDRAIVAQMAKRRG